LFNAGNNELFHELAQVSDSQNGDFGVVPFANSQSTNTSNSILSDPDIGFKRLDPPSNVSFAFEQVIIDE
jgi:hypothetical protein